MSISNQAIKREVFNAVAETCPKVDEALNMASELIKQQTALLREALTEYVERALNAEDELSTANNTIDELYAEIQSLKDEISNLKES